MTYVILDLEWNGAYTRKTHGFFNEIIEIGAVKINDRLEQEDTFHAVIRPVVSRKLTTLVQDLTGIGEEELEEGEPFSRAVSRLRRWIGDRQAVVMTWSTTDLMVLLENCRYFLHSERIPFMNRYADLQAYCQARLHYGTAQQMGLSRACELLEIPEEGMELHRALDDSILTGQVFTRVYEPASFAGAVRAADREFYDRLTFKTVIISDIHDEHVNREDLHFRCEECGRPLRRAGEWKFRSRAFCADFLCRACERKYTARVQVKLKYDGPVTRRKLILKPPDPPAQTADGAGGAEESGAASPA
ncbi:MAG TPA: exonuclease domain-containing protein [Firmicutes bacterium]|nr:exonuclease domain-containing protein [Bacillota bacterium]